MILQRSPYVHLMDMYLLHGKNLAQRGFIYILQFCRGTGQSEGEWEPNVNERQDGLDTLNWLQNEPWVKNIGYWGNSYLALTGWCMADAVPSKVKGMYLSVYGTDRFTSAYSKGMFRHDVLTSWAMEMWDIAWRLQKGSRIRVDISSSDFPQYSIHSNYAGIWSRQEKTRVAHQVIHCGGTYASRLEIPVLDEGD